MEAMSSIAKICSQECTNILVWLNWYRIASLFQGRKLHKFHISVAIYESFIHKNQPGIDSWNVQCNLLPCAYVSTEWPGLLISSIPVGPLLMAMPVSSIMAANKKMKQVVDGTAGERTLCYPPSMRHISTSLLKRRHRYSSKWAGSLELWTSRCCSVSSHV